MARETIIFHPTKNHLLKRLLPLAPMAGFKTAYGLVLHPTIQPGLRGWFGCWDVSDPETGALVIHGIYPGPPGAVAALVQLAYRYRYLGGFRRALERARKRLISPTSVPAIVFYPAGSLGEAVEVA